MHNSLYSIEEAGFRSFGLDLGTGGEGNERIAARIVSTVSTCRGRRNGYVKAIDKTPPPAPEIACAMLSDCCAAVDEAIVERMMTKLEDGLMG